MEFLVAAVKIVDSVGLTSPTSNNARGLIVPIPTLPPYNKVILIVAASAASLAKLRPFPSIPTMYPWSPFVLFRNIDENCVSVSFRLLLNAPGKSSALATISSLASGLLVPIPTLPPDSIVILSKLFVTNLKG